MTTTPENELAEWDKYTPDQLGLVSYARRECLRRVLAERDQTAPNIAYLQNALDKASDECDQALARVKELTEARGEQRLAIMQRLKETRATRSGEAANKLRAQLAVAVEALEEAASSLEAEFSVTNVAAVEARKALAAIKEMT